MVWYEETGLGRNIFALFLRRFRLDAPPASLKFHLFADSLYRLRVNGEIIGYGPARFFPIHPEYDTYDLAPWLQAGENSILVEINSRGAPSFQAVISRAGFIASGDGGTPDLATPGEWLVCQSDAWESGTEPFSFAQGPIEQLDARRLPTGYPAFANGPEGGDWRAPVLVSEPEHWGEPSPRSFALPALDTWTPQKTVLAAAVKGGHVRYGFNAGNTRTRVRQPFFTHVYSETEQEIDLGLFWGPVFINGQELKHETDKGMGNRQNARASLRAGWNFVYGLPDAIQPCWTWLMEFPEIPGLLLRALPEVDCEFSFALGELQDAPPKDAAASAPASLEEVPGYPGAWKFTPGNLETCSPTREMAWDLPDEVWLKDQPYQPGLELPVDGEAATVILDFGREFLGHLLVEFETENGTTLDVGCDERFTKDGILGFYLTNPFVNTAERFICGAGRQLYTTYHERGGRYVQLTFRGRPGRVKVHRMELVRTTPAHEITGNFECGDPLFDWLWPTGIATIHACMGDGWYDCPWRERGMYVGDALVEAPVTRKFMGDWRMEAWAIRLWARGQFANGQLPDVVPSAHLTPLVDYTLLWVHVLRNYWEVTGDAALVREVWPVVGKIFASSVWKVAADGLWEAHPDCFVFLDWGATKGAKLGVNAALNAFRIRSLECAAELAEVLGLPGEAQAYTTQADTVRTAFRRAFWDGDAKRFTACLVDGQFSEEPPPHVNALALVYGLADESQQPGVLAFLKEWLEGNHKAPAGSMELYFLPFVLEGLYRIGEGGLAEDVIRAHYQLLKDRGMWTIPETLGRSMADSGSLCHGWSCGPLIFFSERILGVRPLVPGDPSRMLVAPESDSLNEASGAVPHPQGTIHVSWRIDGSKLRLSLEMPAGVSAEVRPAGRLAGLELVRD